MLLAVLLTSLRSYFAGIKCKSDGSKHFILEMIGLMTSRWRRSLQRRRSCQFLMKNCVLRSSEATQDPSDGRKCRLKNYYWEKRGAQSGNKRSKQWEKQMLNIGENLRRAKTLLIEAPTFAIRFRRLSSCLLCSHTRLSIIMALVIAAVIVRKNHSEVLLSE